MQGFYDAGDADSAYGAYDYAAEEEKRRKEAERLAQQQSPYQTPAQDAPQRQQQGAQPGTARALEQTPQSAPETQTFAQQQAAGKARPAPKAPMVGQSLGGGTAPAAMPQQKASTPSPAAPASPVGDVYAEQRQWMTANNVAQIPDGYAYVPRSEGGPGLRRRTYQEMRTAGWQDSPYFNETRWNDQPYQANYDNNQWYRDLVNVWGIDRPQSNAATQASIPSYAPHDDTAGPWATDPENWQKVGYTWQPKNPSMLSEWGLVNGRWARLSDVYAARNAGTRLPYGATGQTNDQGIDWADLLGTGGNAPVAPTTTGLPSAPRSSGWGTQPTGLTNDQGIDWAALMGTNGVSGITGAGSGAGGASVGGASVGGAAGAPSFTGNIGQYIANQLNGGGPSVNVPAPYLGDRSSVAQMQQLAGAGLPNVPQWQNDPRLQQLAQQLTQQGAVSLNGFNPLAALGAAGNGTGSGSVDAAIADAMRTPSGFDNAAVQQLYDRLGQNIDDQYAQQDTRLREEMASRGLSDSSIQGGRLADLNVGKREAKTELANQLGIQRAQDFAQQRNAAIGLGLQGQQQALQRALGYGNLGLDTQRLGLAAQGQSFGQQLQGLQFQNQLGQQGFQNALSSAQLAAALQGQRFGQGLSAAQFGNLIGQQGFQNQMAIADLMRGMGNDRYSQSLGWLSQLIGLGRDATAADQWRATFNANQDTNNTNVWLQLLQLGLI